MSYVKKTILVIEDEASIAETIGEFFTELNYQVYFATTSTEAILKSQNQAFDCILTDINLEKGTGDSVILTIKSSVSNPNYSTPIIIVSSAVSAELMGKVKDLIDWVFVKPYSIKLVAQKVEEVCSKPAKIHKSNS